MEPALKGTLSVLRAAKDCGVGRVVMVSSQTAMVPNPAWPADKVVDEDSWADIEQLKKLQVHAFLLGPFHTDRFTLTKMLSLLSCMIQFSMLMIQ